jgi:FYVE/RhoGEF/PH domain-containing protein 5/6
MKISATQNERDAWSTAIRNAKASLLVSLNIMHPNSTLTSSASTTHLRRSLQALPFPPNDERIGTIGTSSGRGWGKKGSKIEKGKGKEKGERRGRVEHWVPAIWIPDAKTEGCMRCGRAFGWRRRRHHCRLCGRCVCASCSGKVSSFSSVLFY